MFLPPSDSWQDVNASKNTWTFFENPNLWNKLRSTLHLQPLSTRSTNITNISLVFLQTSRLSSKLPTSAMCPSLSHILYPSIHLPIHPSFHPSITKQMAFQDSLSGLTASPYPGYTITPPRLFLRPPPNITHRSIHTSTDTSTTWTGLYYLTSSSGLLSTLLEKYRSSGRSAFNTHSRGRRNTHTHICTHEMVAKCVSSNSVYLWGSVHTEKPPKRAVCL